MTTFRTGESSRPPAGIQQRIRVFSHNRAFLKNIVQGVLEQPDVRGVMIFDSAGTILIEAGSFSNEREDDNHTKLSFFEQRNRVAITKASEVEAMVSLQHPSHSHGDNLWIYQPIYPEQVPLDEHDLTPVSRQIGAVILEMSWARTENVKWRMAWITIGSSATFLMITYLLVYLASRNIIFPIRKLSHSVRLIGRGQLETRADTALKISSWKHWQPELTIWPPSCRKKMQFFTSAWRTQCASRQLRSNHMKGC